MTIAVEQRLPYWVACGTVLQGWALAAQGQATEGLMRMRQGLAAYCGMGAELLRPYFLALLAEGYGNVGQTKKGMRGLDEALILVHKHGVRFYEACSVASKGGYCYSLEPRVQSLRSSLRTLRPRLLERRPRHIFSWLWTWPAASR